MRKSLALSFVALAGVLAGCQGDVTTALRVLPVNRFVLRSVQGKPLPTELTFRGRPARIAADTITLRNDGTGTMRGVLLVRQSDSAVETPVALSLNLRYTLAGSRIGVAGVYNCPLNGICVAPPRFSGNVTSNGIVFDSASDYLVPLVFEPR